MKSASKPTTSAAGDAPAGTAAPPAPPPITLPPLFKALTDVSYNYMRCLHVWGIPVNDDGAVSIVSPTVYLAGRMKFNKLLIYFQALFLESPLGVSLKVLELRTTGLSPWALVRLSRYFLVFLLSRFISFFLCHNRPLGKVQVTQLNLDYNE